MGCAPTNHARRTVPFGKRTDLENRPNQPQIQTPVRKLQSAGKNLQSQNKPSSVVSLGKPDKMPTLKYSQPLRDMVIRQERRTHKIESLNFHKKEHFMPS